MQKQKQLSTYRWGSGDATHRRSEYFVVLEEGHTFADLFDPQYWGSLEKERKLRLHDVIRCRAADGSFDVMVTIVGLTTGGARVEVWPKLPEEIAATVGDPDALRPVPLLANGLPAARIEPGAQGTLRVIALNQVQYSTHSSMIEAEASLSTYLAAMRMRPMTEDEAADAMIEHEAIKAANAAKLEAKRQQIREKQIGRRGPRQESSAA